MWMIRPWAPPRQITIDLPSILVDSLGVGAEMLARYLTSLAEVGADDPENRPPPLPLLCRICERNIQPWWFEKHTELCMQEHRAEMEVQLAQENLTELRVAIVRILDALETRRAGRRPTSGEMAPPILPAAEYKGLPIGSTPSSTLSSGAVSPAASRSRSRDPSVSHARSRSFAIRRPLSRVVELVLDLCDTAIEISASPSDASTVEANSEAQPPPPPPPPTPPVLALAPAPGSASASAPAPPPTEREKTEILIAQVIHWQSPSTSTLEQERGLALLSADTEVAARAKVQAFLRHRQITEYAERIRVELSVVVQECVDAALHKAARLAAGDLSSSAESTDDEGGLEPDLIPPDEEGDGDGDGNRDENIIQVPLPDPLTAPNPVPAPVQVPVPVHDSLQDSLPGTPAASVEASGTEDGTTATGAVTSTSRRQSGQLSTRSESPRDCPTPRSRRGGSSVSGQRYFSQRSSAFFESDVGDSDSSIRSSSVLSSLRRTESPASEYGLSRASSSRDRKRQSMMLSEAVSSPHRQVSPTKDVPPCSPIQPNRLHISNSHELAPSPITSPLLSGSELQSPAIPNSAYSLTQPPPLLPSVSAPLPNHHHHHHHHHLQLHSHHHSQHHHHHQHQHQHQHHHHRRQSSAASADVNRPPISPRLLAASQPPPRAVPPSIKDFEIIKPISKGAFGSVYLSKKKTTGEYFAIKVLKKADMVAKNQVTNVKAERAILMRQGESDFVAKLYWTFSSKDYLYLVMEYLNGGDCASLIKSLGGLPEDWAKRYVAEVVLCVADLHKRGIIHRDLKPDNLLIDQKGHLKLTDFGLSRMGLIGRQKRILNSKDNDSAPDLLRQGPFVSTISVASSRSASFDLHGGNHSALSTPQITPDVATSLVHPSYFTLNREGSAIRDDSRRTSGYRSDSGGSEALQAMFNSFRLDDPVGYPISPPPITTTTMTTTTTTMPGLDTQSVGSGSPDPNPIPQLDGHASVILPSGSSPAESMMPPPMALFDPEDSGRRFVGTPDYLAPETVNGVGQDEMSDWWSLGCIIFEFLYGYPPFHADSPDKVFENILQRKIDWPADGVCPVSPEAKDVMEMLMCSDPRRRLGSNSQERFSSGGEEIRNHVWFEGIRWESLYEEEAQFVPAPEHPEDTEYFDARGATLHSFTEETEDQPSSPADTPAAAAASASASTSVSGADYGERPHDALSKARSQVTSIKRGLLPLHIPPHVRDGRSRRLSEPVQADDFGSFAFKNLPVLEKANKDVLQKLRQGTMQPQHRTVSSGNPSQASSAGASQECSPILQVPLRRHPSNSVSPSRPRSPSTGEPTNASPSRTSQPTSPLLVSFAAGSRSQHHQRRKTSSTSSGVSHQSSGSLQPNSFFEIPRLPSMIKAHSVASSPIKNTRPLPALPALPASPASPQRGSGNRSVSGGSSSRARSQTVGSQESESPARDLFVRQKRRSGVFELSPSSSDNEETRASALLRVQRRRQSSRRKSRNIVFEGPTFRPLDVLIVEDHPVSRMVMERLLEKLQCHSITIGNGPDAIRYGTGEIKFDVILMEFRLPQINGADVARMIRDTKNVNSHTPIIAVTGYLKELPTPNHFDALVEKPPTTSKLVDVIGRLCHWTPPPPGQELGQIRAVPSSGLRHEFSRHADSPSSASSGFAPMPGITFRGSSREDSVSSSLFGDSESINAEEPHVVMNRPAMDEWRDNGLCIVEEGMVEPKTLPPTLMHQQSAPPALPSKPPVRQRSAEKIRAKRETMEKQRHQCDESGDDEDEELGDVQVRAKSPQRKDYRSSKLGIEMLRTNSRGSVVSTSELSSRETSAEPAAPIPEEADVPSSATPPEVFPPLDEASFEGDFSVTPKSCTTAAPADEDPTPRPNSAAPLAVKGRSSRS